MERKREEQVMKHHFRYHKDVIRGEVTDFLKEDIPAVPMVILNFNVYCPVVYSKGLSMPGEIGISAFTIRDGLIDTFTTLIDPGHVPPGCAMDVKESIAVNGLKFPGYDKNLQDLKAVVNAIDKFMRKHSLNSEWPPVFCMENEMVSFYGCMDWLYQESKIGAPPKEFRLRPLEMMLHRASELGRIYRDAEEGIEPLQESMEAKETRQRLSSAFGVGGNLIPVVSRRDGSILVKFPKERHPLTECERLVEKLARFCDETHSRQYLGSTYNAFNEEFACEYHRKMSHDDGNVLKYCSSIIVKRLAINCVDALKSLFISE